MNWKLINLLKTSNESKGSRINFKKIPKPCAPATVSKPTYNNVKYPEGVCKESVGANAIICKSCDHYMHKRCSNVRGSLSSAWDFKCQWCQITLTEKPCQMMQNVRIGENTLEVRISCYLGGVCKQYGSQRSLWKVFCELLLFLTRRVIFLKARGFV